MNNRIYSAGPYITKKEVEYVLDAVKSGWYSKYKDYLELFEKKFAEYVNAKYAIATPCGTAALHMAMVSTGIKSGDEVIVPDISWVATANVIAITGATPVFVDIEKGSWTIDAIKIKEAITPKTKVIMPVHSYGHPADMDEINRIAKDHNLLVVEDAAPSAGSLYKGRKTGTLGDIGCFSFQGAKILATGEGGMFVTNNDEFYKKALMFASHNRNDSKTMFWSAGIGLKYSMGNITAALGLAQLERIDELVSNKRKIFDKYYNYLNGFGGISLFKEKEGYFSNCSFPSILLSDRLNKTRDQLQTELKKRNIDSRPAFPRMSRFPAFEERFGNPVAEYVDKNGLNLPSAHNITEQQIEQVCKEIKDILAN